MFPGTFAESAPERPAVVIAETGERLTYRVLDEQSRRLARLLHDRGLRRGAHLAVLLENHPRYFEVVWAGLRSGLHVTPINRHLTAEETAYILQDCGADALVASSALAEVAQGATARTPACRTRLMMDAAHDGFEPYEATVAESPDQPVGSEPSGTLMLYSSGTTGRPKGILKPLPDGSIRDGGLGSVPSMLRELWGFAEDTIYLSPAPLYHGAPIGFTTAVQALGGTVVVMKSFDAARALQSLEQYRVTHSQWVPTMFTRMLKLDEAYRHGRDFLNHRVAIHAGAPCPTGVKQEMFAWWGPILHEYYGGTELNGMTYASPEDWLTHPGTVGKPMLGTVHICGEDGRTKGAGEDGVVYFELPEMPFVYHNDADQTRAVQHPTHPNWTTLGEIGHLDDEGFLYLTDRTSFMIVSGGVNIYPQEIEDVLIMHAKVADAAVIGVPNDDMGEEVKAIIEPVSGTEPSAALAADILQHLQGRLARYKIPRSIEFDEIPRLPTGKLSKRRLKERYWKAKGSRII